MRRNTFDENRDHHIAAETHTERALMCAAQGCPMRWSVDFGKRLCSAHFRADANPHSWPRITQELIEAETERAYRSQLPKPEPQRVNKAAAIAALRRLAPSLNRPMNRDWAHQLQERADRGDHLTPFQRECMETALHGRMGFVGPTDPRATHPTPDTLPPAMRPYLEEFN